MPNYNLGCIYKIKHYLDYDDDNIYIGSTCNLIRRRHQHKCNCNKENNINYNIPLYQYIRENGGWDAFIMIKIHDYNCNSKSDLATEERRMIDMLKPKLNKQIPTRSQKEYYEDNREVLIEKSKERYENNKEIIIEKNKEKYQVNRKVILEKKKDKCECDICGAEVTKSHLKRHKKTQKCLSVKNNLCTKQDIAEKHKEWYEANKEIIAEKRKEKCKCDICGAEIRKYDLPRHKKTQKCLSVKNNV